MFHLVKSSVLVRPRGQIPILCSLASFPAVVWKSSRARRRGCVRISTMMAPLQPRQYTHLGLHRTERKQGQSIFGKSKVCSDFI